MTSAITFGDANTGFQAGVVHGPVNTAFHLRPNLNNVLDSLPFAQDAPFYAYQRQHDPTCLPDTRVDLLREIYGWADGEDSPSIFWLSGLAGTGKSTIARTVSRSYFDQKRLGASFFFSRGGGDVSHAGKFVTSIAVQLAHNVPTFRRRICDAITERGDIVSQSLRDQWHHLVLHPLSKLQGSDCPFSCVLVVDALDECDDDNNIRIIVQLLAEARSLETVRLRVFLTSRPEIPIRYGIRQIPDAEHQDFVLHNVSPSVVDHDISIFLQYNLQLIGQEHCLDAGWPGPEVIITLVRSASGLFIWAATACRFIREGLFADERLCTLIDGGASDVPATPIEHLDRIYTTVLLKCVRPEYIAREKEKFYSMLRDILGSIVALLSPLSVESLSRVLHIPEQRVDRMLKDLHAILDIPEDKTRPLRLHHPSFRDFLLDKDRCGDSNFWMTEKQANCTLAHSCIRLMSENLRRDVCGLRSSGALTTEILQERIKQCLPADLQYASLYWLQHIQKSDNQLQDDGEVHVFLQKHLLHWFEIMSLLRMMSKAGQVMKALQSIIKPGSAELFALVHDAIKFILKYGTLIEATPLQVYSSALIFSPRRSRVRKQFWDSVPRWIKTPPAVPESWSASLQTLEGHSGSVRAVSFSPDGKLVASASNDKTVRLWDSATGASLQTLEGHSSSVTAIAFSPDGKLIVSASDDETVRLWNSATGAPLHTLKGHSGSIRGVAFSPEGKLVASASNDETVWLWDSTIGVSFQTLKGHLGSVTAVAFSPEGKLVASASDDKTVRLWNSATGSSLRTLKGHFGSVMAMAFSPKGELIVSASDDRTLQLWDTATGASLHTLEGHSGWIWAVSFSPDSKLIASASGDKTVRLWDSATGTPLRTLKGHSDWATAVAFSADGKLVASTSRDKTVRLWNSATGASLQTLEGHSDWVAAVAFSPDGELVASASDDKTVRLWDTAMGAPLNNLKGHSGWVWAVAFSPDGKLVVSASDDKTVRLWDSATGALLQTLEGHSSSVTSTAFSPDGKLVVSASDDETVRLWDSATGALQQTLKGHSGSVMAVAFSPEGKLIASASDDKTIQLWDSATGASLQVLQGHFNSVLAVAFSPDGKLVASASSDQTVRLWDSATGTLLQTLKGHTGWVTVVVFSPDGKLVASASRDKTVRLWDSAIDVSPQTLEGHSSWVWAVAFSPDGKLVASASRDHTVRLWDSTTGALLHILTGHSNWVMAVTFSLDSKLIASASGDETVRLWDSATGVLLQTLKAHSGWVWAVALSPDGKQVASASVDKSVRLWDSATGTLLQTLEVDAVMSMLSFSKEGAYLKTGRGLLSVQSFYTGGLVRQPQPQCNIYVKGHWVVRDAENLLWLHSDYRPICSTIHGNILMLGHTSGRVTFIEFTSL